MSQRPGEPIRWRRNPPLTTASLDSAPLLALILVAAFAITSLHSYQEWKGAGAPLWRNFGAIAGLDVPDRWGLQLFTVLLTLILFVIGFVGIAGLFGPCLTAAALGALTWSSEAGTIETIAGWKKPTSHPASRTAFDSALGNEQGERTFELRSLGEFDATSLLLPHKILQLVGGQCLPQR